MRRYVFKQIMSIQILEIGDIFYKQAVELRYDLFFKKHELPKSIVFDENETISTHAAIIDSNELIAYGRLTKSNEGEFIISQMVVSPMHQNKGLGSKVLQNIMLLAIKDNAQKITLSARLTALHLYKKQGFNECGTAYVSPKTGVKHVKMQYIVNT